MVVVESDYQLRIGVSRTSGELTKLYNLKELEETLGVSRRTLYRYIKDGKLKAVKIGGMLKVTAEDYNRFINGEK